MGVLGSRTGGEEPLMPPPTVLEAIALGFLFLPPGMKINERLLLKTRLRCRLEATDGSPCAEGGSPRLNSSREKCLVERLGELIKASAAAAARIFIARLDTILEQISRGREAFNGKTISSKAFDLRSTDYRSSCYANGT